MNSLQIWWDAYRATVGNTMTEDERDTAISYMIQKYYEQAAMCGCNRLPKYMHPCPECRQEFAPPEG